MIYRCLILSKSHRGYDEEINQFLQEDSIYSTIQTVLSHLSISQYFSFDFYSISSQTVFVLYSLTNLIRSICHYNIAIRKLFTERNGIEITLQIFNFTVPNTVHSNVIQFTTSLIKDLWSGDEGRSVLSTCSIHQLMELILWSANCEIDDDQIDKSVGINSMLILIAYASEKTSNGSMSDYQELLLKFGVPRLLILFADVISYSRFSQLKFPQNRLRYCEMLLSIIGSLCTNLVYLSFYSYS